MNVREEALTFECGSDVMLGVLHEPEQAARNGVVIIVGGPQYRVGSHRQFVLLARHLAESGVPTLRFDYRGMGDATGDARTFESIDDDIRCAIDRLVQRCPTLERVVLLGLCDAASASLMYAHTDSRVAGVVLLNPWARAEQTLAATYLRHYYLQRFLQKDFWMNLLRGKFSVTRSLSELAGNLRKALGGGGTSGAADTAEARQPFLTRMLNGLRKLNRPVLLVISGKDLTAAEFLGAVNASPDWTSAMKAAALTRHDVPDADHTFSRRAWRDEVADVAAKWVRAL